MDKFLVLLVFFGLAAAYLTHILLFDTEYKETHYGPFPDRKRLLRFPDHVRPVTFFDWIRRPFGVYVVQGNNWHVDEKLNRRIDRWTCPYCLSFWVSLVLTLPFSYFTKIWINYTIPEAVIMFVMSIFAMSAIASGICVKVFD